MFYPLCLLLSIFMYWPCVSSRYVAQQPFISPYTDYSYSYSDHSPFHAPFRHQPYNSPAYSPPGTYFDQRQGVLRPFPGGGVPVLVDYHKRCSNQYVGLKAHPDQQQYYYVCKPDCIIFGKCQNLQIFNGTKGQCVQHPPPEYTPICSSVGRFPLFSDCHLYYKCEKDLQPKIYSCPENMVFSPANKKCINGNKCTPTQISPRSSYMPEYCANKFPPCFENGVFRSPLDCSLYYKCDLKQSEVYMQTRLRCPLGKFYDLQKQECLPSQQVPCDCIQVTELVYPKQHLIPYQPAVYPSQYNIDSIEDNQYPVEHTKPELNNICNEGDAKCELSTTLLPTAMANNDGDRNALVLADFKTSKSTESQESDELRHETTISSEETTNTQDSDEEFTTLNLAQENATENEVHDIITNKLEEEQNLSTIITTTEKQMESQDNLTELPSKVEKDNEFSDAKLKNLTDNKLTANTAQAQLCANIIESNDKWLTKDTQTKDTTQTQIQNCLRKLTNTKSEILSANTRGSRSTLHTQTSMANKNITQLATKKIITLNSASLLRAPVPKNKQVLAAEHNNLNLEVSATTDNPHKFENINKVIKTTVKAFFKDAFKSLNSLSAEDISDNDKTLASLKEKINKNLRTNEILEIEPAITQATTKTTHATTPKVSSKIPILNSVIDVTTSEAFNVNKTTQFKAIDSENNIEWIRGPLLDKPPLLTGSSPQQQPKSANVKPVDFREEELIPALNKTTFLNELTDETTNLSLRAVNLAKDFYDDILDPNEITTAAVITTTKKSNSLQSVEKLRKGRTSANKTKQLTTTKAAIQTTTDKDFLAKPTTTEQPTIREATITITKENSGNRDSQKDLLSSLDLETIIQAQKEEMSQKNVISEQGFQQTVNSRQHNRFIDTATVTPIQTPTATPDTITKSTLQKHANNLVLHVRAEDHVHPLVDTPPRHNLFYTLNTKPVINNNNNKNNTIVAPAAHNTVPRLEIIAERPIDVHLSVCPSTCGKNHKHHFTPAGKRAVLLKWFSNKSKQTLGFETANERTDDD